MTIAVDLGRKAIKQTNKTIFDWVINLKQNKNKKNKKKVASVAFVNKGLSLEESVTE